MGTVTDEAFDTDGPGGPRILRVYSAPVHGDIDNERKELLGRIFVFRDVTRETMVDRMKTEFVSTVSHELRTPLTAIKGYIDLMVSGKTGPLTPVQDEFLTLVQGSTRRLTNLINDMLDISRIEAGRIEISPDSVEYVPLVRQAIRMMEKEAEARQISLHLEVLGRDEETMGPSHAPVSGDADRITQVLTNFLSNSIKYTLPGGDITVRIEFEDDFVTTCIEDTGIGISPEDQAKLFQKFFRADNSTTREVGGTGLGLAITKAILERLNGSVWVESEPGRGSRFWFTLPTLHAAVAAEETATSPATEQGVSAEPAPTAQTMALSIDGDIAILHRLGHQLRHQGFITTHATTEADALRRARSLHPDVITLNPLSPTLDGLSILRALQENPATRKIPVALIHPAFAGDRSDLRDTFALLPPALPPAQLEATLRAALHWDRRGTEGGQTLTVVFGAPGMTTRVRDAVKCIAPRVATGVAVAPTIEAADRFLGGEHLPLALVIESEAPVVATAIGAWLVRFQQRHPEVRVAILIEWEADEKVVLLPPLGAGTLPLSKIRASLMALIGETQHGGERTASAPEPSVELLTR